MTTEEIHDAIKNCPTVEPFMSHMLAILQEINNHSARIEKRVADLEEDIATLKVVCERIAKAKA